MNESQNQHAPAIEAEANVCPTCHRALKRRSGRPRLSIISGPLPDVTSGTYVGPAVAGKLLGGLTLEQIANKAPGGLSGKQLRRLDADLQPQRSATGERLYDLAKVQALAATLKLKLNPPDVTGEWLSLRAVVELTGLQEQTIRAADARLQPRRPLTRSGKPGARIYHRNVVYQEMLRIGGKFQAVETGVAVEVGPSDASDDDAPLSGA